MAEPDLNYNETVLDHFRAPRNAGALADAHAQLVHVVGAEARAREQGVRQLPAAQHRPPRVVAQLA